MHLCQDMQKFDSNPFQYVFADEKDSSKKKYIYIRLNTSMVIYAKIWFKYVSMRLCQDIWKSDPNPFKCVYAEESLVKKPFPFEYVYAKIYENQIQIHSNAFMPMKKILVEKNICISVSTRLCQNMQKSDSNPF